MHSLKKLSWKSVKIYIFILTFEILQTCVIFLVSKCNNLGKHIKTYYCKHMNHSCKHMNHHCKHMKFKKTHEIILACDRIMMYVVLLIAAKPLYLIYIIKSVKLSTLEHDWNWYSNYHFKWLMWSMAMCQPEGIVTYLITMCNYSDLKSICYLYDAKAKSHPKYMLVLMVMNNMCFSSLQMWNNFA